MPAKTANLNRSGGGPATSSSDSQLLTVRPLPTEPVSHKLALRVHIHKTALAALDLKSGSLCTLSISTDQEDAPLSQFPAIAWQTTGSQPDRHVVLVSDCMRKLVGVSFDKKVIVKKYPGTPESAQTVVLREIDGQADPSKNSANASKSMDAKELEGWRWFLRQVLFESIFVMEGLVFGQVEYMGRRRAFSVEKISSGPPAQVDAVKDKNILPVYKTTESTDVTLATQHSSPAIVVSSRKKSERNGAETAAPLSLMAPSNTTFASIGGLDSQISRLKTELLSALHQSHHFARVSLKPPRGVLLYGPPGTGKTLMLKAIASEIKAQAFVVSGSVVGRYMGESEAAVRKVFADARKNQPAIIFIDEVDALAPKRADGEASEGRVVTTLLTEMDGMEISEDGISTKVVVVAATNRPNSIDEALRRPGRFDKEIEIGIPDAEARRQILGLLMKKIPFKADPETRKDREEYVKALAGRTHGYVGADLENLVRGGFTNALKRLGVGRQETAVMEDDNEAEAPTLYEEDMELAFKDVRPTAMREVFLEAPNVRWSDIGGQEEVKQRLREAVEWPLTHPEAFQRLGGTPRKGLLLYGPPGCSKTLTAKALATESGLNFMAVKGPEIFSMYVGQSEAKVREVFRKARAASPSIIFFDEIDALSASREGHRGGGVNVLTALLNEMDGIEALKNVIVLAATNRPEIIDPALMRPGRLDTILYVGPPDLDARRQILRIKTGKMSVSDEVDMDELASRTDGFSGAEIVNLCDEAIHYAMRESFDIEAVGKRHFEMALRKAVPQITVEMRRAYEAWSVGGVKKI